MRRLVAAVAVAVATAAAVEDPRGVAPEWRGVTSAARSGAAAAAMGAAMLHPPNPAAPTTPVERASVAGSAVLTMSSVLMMTNSIKE